VEKHSKKRGFYDGGDRLFHRYLSRSGKTSWGENSRSLSKNGDRREKGRSPIVNLSLRLAEEEAYNLRKKGRGVGKKEEKRHRPREPLSELLH